jgi:hypothetical protein
VLVDVTDNPFFGRCASCGRMNISETEITCSNCGYDLGTSSKLFSPRSLPNTASSRPYAPLLLPELPTSHSFIDFECVVFAPSGFTVFGDGPVAVEYISDLPTYIQPGILKHKQGEFECLIDRGLIPSVGDIIGFVEGVSVGHLSSHEVKYVPKFLLILPGAEIYRKSRIKKS